MFPVDLFSKVLSDLQINSDNILVHKVYSGSLDMKMVIFHVLNHNYKIDGFTTCVFRQEYQLPHVIFSFHTSYYIITPSKAHITCEICFISVVPDRE